MIDQVEQLEMKPAAKTNGLSNSPVGKIIIVDDEPELKDTLVKALSAQGFEVTGCSSGQQALAELHQKEFDLLLTDLMMPEMDGIALLEAALKVDPHLIGIMMTGQGTIQTAVDAMKVGAFDYVLKPFRLQTVMPVLTRAINTRRLRMENLQLCETVAIYGLCQTISFTLDAQTVLSRLADAALQQSDADEVSILLPTSDGKELFVAAVRGEKRERLLGERVPLQKSISSWVARERMPLILNGEVHDERFVALWPRPEIHSAVSVPMQVANKLVGIINLNVTNRLLPFTSGQMKALTILASTAAAALESASLHTQVQQAEKNYRSIFENAVEGIFQSTPDRRFLTVNPAMAHILGYESPEEVVNSFTDIGKQLFVDPALPAEGTRTLKERGVLQGFEFEAYRKDGEKIWLSLNMRVIRDDQGAEVCREGTVEDITERKRAEDQLRQAKDFSENLIQTASVVIIGLDVEGNINIFNQTAEKITGYSAAELKGRSWFEKLVPRDRYPHVWDEFVRLVGGGTPQPFENPILTRSGEERYIMWQNSPVRVDGKIVTMISFGNDITERKRARAEQLVMFEIIQGFITTRNLDELLKLIHKSIGKLLYAENCFVGLYDESTSLMHFEYWADQFDSGPPPHPPGKGFSSYVLRTNKPLLLTEELKSRMYSSGEVEQAGRSSASWLGVPLRMSSRAIGVLVVQHYEDKDAYSQRDLEFLSSVGDQIALAIGRKRAEEGLRESEERYRLLFESNPQPMWVYDLETLAFLAVNESAVRHYGYSREDFLAMTIKDIRPADELPALYDSIARRSEGVNGVGIWRHLKKDGTIIEVEITSHLLVFDDRRAELILAHDITERNRLEAALLASEEQLRQSQKLEAIGQLAGGVAHDFNNLLTVIGGYSSILLGKLPQKSPHRSSIEEIKKASDRAGALTRQLLAFSRKQILQPKVLDLNIVVTDLEKMVRRLIGEDIDLLTITSPVLGRVKADPGQIEQVLLNLIVNARDAMQKGGKLTIETRNVVHSEEYAQRHATLPGPYVMLAVSDTGCGMDAAIQPRVFEPFFTTKDSGQGTGLGLATVYGIVKQSGGNIWVYSEVGRGSTFKVYLPRVDEAKEEEGISKSIPKGTEMVLLVEDEDQVRAILKHILEGQGYHVIAASSGEEALSISQDLERDIKLMITDVVMPQMSGRELAERVQAVRPNLPVLFMSGYTDDAIVRHGLLDEKLNFIQKPFDSTTVARKVREVLDSHL